MFTCEETNTIVLSGVSTLLLSGFVGWWFLFKDPPKQVEPIEPEYCVEIPHNWLTFQKYAHALLQDPLPSWCQQEQMNYEDVLWQMYDWMKQQNHVNFVDLHNVLSVLHDSIDEHMYCEAYKWFQLACLVWSIHPEAEMVYWNGTIDDNSKILTS